MLLGQACNCNCQWCNGCAIEHTHTLVDPLRGIFACSPNSLILSLCLSTFFSCLFYSLFVAGRQRVHSGAPHPPPTHPFTVLTYWLPEVSAAVLCESDARLALSRINGTRICQSPFLPLLLLHTCLCGPAFFTWYKERRRERERDRFLVIEQSLD